ncbi:MAG TPA: hypothetical protein VMH49_02680 [Thermoplasmata archaeon]|nr:hypothetical protein [Thermoplasmata archaeon]
MPRSRRGSRDGAGGAVADRGPDPTCAAWNLQDFEAAIAVRLERWGQDDAVGRIWRRDPSFWPASPASDVTSRLGWLLAPEQSASRVDELAALAEAVAGEGLEQVVLLGMGGSSLAAETICRVLPLRDGRPRFLVLDSTHPAAVRSCLRAAPVDRSIYLVSSKSGTTLEPNAFFRFFWEKAQRLPGDAGRHFVAITDPGTELEKLASARGFRACFTAPPDVGGRYSALTVFGLVPAALAGADVPALLASARAMVALCNERVEPLRNPGLRLGATLGELALAGHDKLLFLATRAFRPFPYWAEQLVAESLGKVGRGIVPVGTPTPPDEFPSGDDLVSVDLGLTGRADRPTADAIAAHEAAGVPVLRFRFEAPTDLGREFFRWEFAIAACGAVIGVDPFDQPDVERAKDLARAAMTPTPAAAAAVPEVPRPLALAQDGGAPDALERWARAVRPRDYVAVQAFLPPDRATDAALEAVASALRRRLNVVVTVGYGPRFLHSTGQLHKGGPPTGAFLQIVDRPEPELPVPELGLTFGAIVAAQASGDRTALTEKRRRLVAVDVAADEGDGLARLATLLAGGAEASDGSTS